MQEVNWGKFRAKFNGKEQRSFEWLCYLLFCKEAGMPNGVMRFVNQSGIETEPIEIDGEKVGWQAKFYDVKLSSRKSDLIETIDTSATRYPEMKKIIFFTNQDFGKSKYGNEPKCKTEVEEYAKSKKLVLEWRTASYFESPSVCENNETIAQYFFTLEKSNIDLISELIVHTNSILKPIRSEIQYGKTEIKIDRSKVKKDLIDALGSNSLVILSGEAGVGKTAVVKELFEERTVSGAFYLFKATEFNIADVNILFSKYGSFSLSDLLKAHDEVESKMIVIDSAEKLSDIEDKNAFQSFLSSIIDNGWKVLFTTRISYLDDLKFQLVEIYHRNFCTIQIERLSGEEIGALSDHYSFVLPENRNLCSLLQIPFYLNEYLKESKNVEPSTLTEGDFRSIIWNRIILKTLYRRNSAHIRRGECFLILAKRRADSGQFFVTAGGLDSEILQRLVDDEIIKYEDNADGYFITHDIYEEWALEKIIERAFTNTTDFRNFYQSIGSSLPIRRAFRLWTSGKLFVQNSDIQRLVTRTIDDDDIENHWKDECLISVMLSDHSAAFFQDFEEKMLANDLRLLRRTIYLLQIACKEIDEEILSHLSAEKQIDLALKTIFTKPKGSGWDAVIAFVYKHREVVGVEQMALVLPVIHDWNNNMRKGITTKNSSLLALYFYNELTNDNKLRFNIQDETSEKLISTILNGSLEVKEDLKHIFTEVLQGGFDKRTRHRELIRTCLSSAIESNEIAKHAPDHLLRLAGLFWFKDPGKVESQSWHRMGIEQCFGLRDYHSEYYPPSAYQTPIYQLLRYHPKKTIDYILAFTNKAVECYSRSEHGQEAEQVDVYIDDSNTVKQYISDRLWNTYRGTQVSTYLLESIHMALEKWLLESARTMPRENLIGCCKYLMRNSSSASITAVIASIVFANPVKLFDVALILFRTKELFSYDLTRMLFEQTAANLCSMGVGINYQNRIFENERMNALKEEHRNSTLETLAFSYQLFKYEDDTTEDVEERRNLIWSVLDKYYADLPEPLRETDRDKTWRLTLARMDYRKMKPVIEEKDGQDVVRFEPEIDPELKKHSEENQNVVNSLMKHTALKLWAYYRFEGDPSKVNIYRHYDSDPKRVLKEVKEIINEFEDSDGSSFDLLNHAIPAYACAVVIRDFAGELDSKGIEFCKDILLGYACRPLREHYPYQLSDGVNPAVASLPHVVRYFPEASRQVKQILLLLLFDSYPLGTLRRLSDYSIRSIQKYLWDINFDDANSIFLGFLVLIPKYLEFRLKIWQENYKQGVPAISASQVCRVLCKKCSVELERVLSNDLRYTDLPALEGLDLDALATAFELLPLKTQDEKHKAFVRDTIAIFARTIFSLDRNSEEPEAFDTILRFLRKLSPFILFADHSDIELYLKPLIESYNCTKYAADLLSEFVSAEDDHYQYDSFWIIWEHFYPKIVKLVKNSGSAYYTSEIIHNYLLAWPYWRENLKKWRSLKNNNKAFFERVSREIGDHPAVLYSISKLMNEIGSEFLDDGITWISDILKENHDSLHDNLEKNTIYYLEKMIRSYILQNRLRLRSRLSLKLRVLVVLDFLIENGSVTGYLLREDVL